MVANCMRQWSVNLTSIEGGSTPCHIRPVTSGARTEASRFATCKKFLSNQSIVGGATLNIARSDDAAESSDLARRSLLVGRPSVAPYAFVWHSRASRVANTTDVATLVAARRGRSSWDTGPGICHLAGTRYHTGSHRTIKRICAPELSSGSSTMDASNTAFDQSYNRHGCGCRGNCVDGDRCGRVGLAAICQSEPTRSTGESNSSGNAFRSWFIPGIAHSCAASHCTACR